MTDGSLELTSHRLFYMRFSFFIYVGTLNVYIEAHVSANLDHDFEIDLLDSVAGFEVEPTITVTGGAFLRLLVSFTNNSNEI